ncbi:MAG: YgiT-type zinc finger protein [Chloroflexi bacterium]|nr:MAG: YgiT-type zinc finger protein [Chloroflexota bacterium]
MNICPTCHTGRLQKRLVSYLEWHGGALLVVNKMPAIVCDVCGERIYDHTALEDLQRLLWSPPMRTPGAVPRQN